MRFTILVPQKSLSTGTCALIGTASSLNLARTAFLNANCFYAYCKLDTKLIVKVAKEQCISTDTIYRVLQSLLLTFKV
jgi:hypothetical protein